jgi:hypothetical protein
MLGRNSLQDTSQIYAELAPAKKLWKPKLDRNSLDDKSSIDSEL